ncbi:MAG: NADP-dependent oxidoreductase, partial [Frankia sp.]
FVLVGALAGQLSPDGSGTVAPVELDTYQVILKHVTLRGLDNSVVTGWIDQFGAWLRQGEITFPLVRVAGIERAAHALSETVEGRHLGAVIVEL